MARFFIGTSGFSYKHWKGEFYPQDLPQSKWFEFYCQHFDTVELNVSFYRLPKKETFEKWRRVASTSEEGIRPPRRCRPFVFAVKGNRYITHVKKLKDCQEAVGKFFEAAEGLRVGAEVTHRNFDSASDSLAKEHTLSNETHCRSQSEASQNLMGSPRLFDVVLWQLPPRFKAFGRSDLQGGRTSLGNVERLREFLGLLPKTWRHAFEFRDESWKDTRVYDLLRQYNAAIVFQDYPDWPITEEITADFVYLRFHGRQTLYSSCYTEKDLERWAKKIRDWMKKDLDVYAYFNNDALGYAVENARTLKELAANT